MKFALNGALTIGTLDGANIEIMEEVGRDNIFIFGMTTAEVNELKLNGYNPASYYNQLPELKKTLDMIATGYFSPTRPDLFRPIVDSLLNQGDSYMLLADFASYMACQEEVGKVFAAEDEWGRRAVLNIAGMGKFSSDRTIAEYARDIWGVSTVEISAQAEHCMHDGICLTEHKGEQR